MAHISEGPVSTMPGSVRPAPEGQTCDTGGHEDRLAVKRVQGETDSFGCEYFDCCQECYDKYLEERKVQIAEDSTGICDWCNEPATDLRKRRDFEEGSAGRLYDVCGACVRKESEECEAELAGRDQYDKWDQFNEFDFHHEGEV